MTNHHDVRGQVGIFNEIRDRLATLYNLSDDDEFIVGSAEGETDLSEAICRLLREAKATEAMADGLAGLIKIYHARKARLDHKAERLRGIAIWAMGESGLNKVTAPDLTASLRAGKSKLIIDEQLLPVEFRKATVTYRPDREAIQEAVDGGAVPEGVSVSNPEPVLTIRTK